MRIARSRSSGFVQGARTDRACESDRDGRYHFSGLRPCDDRNPCASPLAELGPRCAGRRCDACGAVLSVYLLVPLSNQFAEKISFRWQPVIVWGGLRGALALALANSKPHLLRVSAARKGVSNFRLRTRGMGIRISKSAPFLCFHSLEDQIERLGRTHSLANTSHLGTRPPSLEICHFPPGALSPPAPL